MNLDWANTKLNRVTIIKRGNKLSLRATLPPKPGDGIKPKRYTISTGLFANATGLKLALAKAQKLESDLIYERFSWGVEKGKITVAEAITEFEQDSHRKTEQMH